MIILVEQCGRSANSTNMCSWLLQVLLGVSLRIKKWTWFSLTTPLFCLLFHSQTRQVIVFLRPDSWRACVDQASAGGVSVAQAHRGGPRHLGVHHQVVAESFAFVYWSLVHQTNNYLSSGTLPVWSSGTPSPMDEDHSAFLVSSQVDG